LQELLLSREIKRPAAPMGEIAFAFAVRCAREKEVEPLVAAFQELIARVGFNASAGGAWVRSGGRNMHRFYFNNWPKEWLDLYQEHAKFEDDLLVIESGRRMQPFLASEVRGDPALARASEKLLAAFDAFGWRDVFTVPVHGPGGYNGLVALATMRPVALDPVDRSALEIMSLALHRRCRETLDFGSAQPPVERLTPRQLECLRWVAAGKSEAAIGKILGVSAATVHFHVETAKKRLKVASRVEAIAKVILSGQL